VALPVSIGVVTFLPTAGPSVLAWRNIRWMSQGDPATYFLSWHFFRNTPWGWPLGTNPRYGAELAGGIAHADNIPLLTLCAKAVEEWLPMFASSSALGSSPASCFRRDSRGSSWGSSRTLDFRERAVLRCSCLHRPFSGACKGHYAMQGQWLVLAALYLCLGPRRFVRGAVWPLLVFVAALVNAYIAAMVLGLWLTDWLRRVRFDRRKRADAVELASVSGMVLLGFWQAGFFEIGEGIVKAGFGKYRMNLLSRVDSSGWSYVLADIPEGRGDYEGFNYLGAGGIVLALIALPALRHAWPALRSRPQYWPLFGLLLALSGLAVSTSIRLADAPPPGS
jgi:hypothetical protein